MNIEKAYYCDGMKFFGERCGLIKYNEELDSDKPVLFLGLYFNDCYVKLMEHTGEKAIYWMGSDVLRLLQYPERVEILKKFPDAIHYCDNKLLQKELTSVGINANIKIRFFGNINKYQITYKWSPMPRIYLIAHPGREVEYGVPIVLELAEMFYTYTFHIYGVNGIDRSNVIFHGQVNEEVMDREIERYHCCLRCNLHDGFSQTVMKSILMGQYPIVTEGSYIDGIWMAKGINEVINYLKLLAMQKEPNYSLRNTLIKKLREESNW
jgi:hypothetical protein